RMVPLGLRLQDHFYHPHWNAPAPEWMRVDGVKYFHDDGARLTRFEIRELVDRAAQDPQPVVVHVLSREALDSLVDGLEARARAPHHPEVLPLFRIDHADEVLPAQAHRLARLGMTVCSNPSMLPEWHAPAAFPLRTLLDAGVHLCAGSDWIGSHQPERP